MGIAAVLRNFDMHRAVTSIAQITVLQAEGAVEYSLAGQPYEHCTASMLVWTYLAHASVPRYSWGLYHPVHPHMLHLWASPVSHEVIDVSRVNNESRC